MRIQGQRRRPLKEMTRRGWLSDADRFSIGHDLAFSPRWPFFFYLPSFLSLNRCSHSTSYFAVHRVTRLKSMVVFGPVVPQSCPLTCLLHRWGRSLLHETPRCVFGNRGMTCKWAARSGAHGVDGPSLIRLFLTSFYFPLTDKRYQILSFTQFCFDVPPQLWVSHIHPFVRYASLT